MWRHYVYLHRKADTGEPFYVGKGTERSRHKQIYYERAYTPSSRNIVWQRTVAKHGLVVEIVASCESDTYAQELEMALIRQYGRRNVGVGPLINLTDGGDGHAGILVSAELRAKRSRNSRGPRSEAWVQSIRKARKNGGNGGVVKKGDKLPDLWKERIAATKIGEQNPMFGRTGEKHPNRRGVIDDRTGDTFPTVTAAAAYLGIRVQTLHNMLTGFRPNNTSMRFA